MGISGGTYRLTENTYIDFPETPQSLYMTGYSESVNDVLKLVHEGGHLIHAKLMSEHRIIPSYASVSEFMFEAFVLLNELLVLDEFKNQNITIEGKRYYTKAFLDKLALEVFQSVEEGFFEEGLYERVANHTIKTSTDINNLYTGVKIKYGPFFLNEPFRNSEWIGKRLVFDDPLYNINYLQAMLLAIKFYTMSHEDPTGFALKYKALLQNGFDASASNSLERFVAIKVDNDALLESNLNLMKEKTTEFSKLNAFND